MKMPLDRILTIIAAVVFTVATIAFISTRSEIYEQTDPLSDSKHKDFREHIKRIDEKIKAKQRRLFGDRKPTPEEEAKSLTREELAFREFLNFCTYGLCASRNPFPYLSRLRPYEDLLREMGAHGCLSALSNLESTIDRYEQCETKEERAVFLRGAKQERKLADQLVEGCRKFSFLLIEWAEASPNIGDAP